MSQYRDANLSGSFAYINNPAAKDESQLTQAIDKQVRKHLCQEFGLDE